MVPGRVHYNIVTVITLLPSSSSVIIRHCRLQTLTLQSSSLKLLDQLKPNLVGMFIEQM
jgi:hypothetical protein